MTGPQPLTVTAGQTYRWLGATVLVDEVASDGSGCRITIRQDGCRPRQKWTPLPLPPEAQLVDSPQSEHHSTCWQVHDHCALAYAAEQTAHLLDLFRLAIDGHAEGGCRGDCYAVAQAREVLRDRSPRLSGADTVQAAAAEIAGLP